MQLEAGKSQIMEGFIGLSKNMWKKCKKNIEKLKYLGWPQSSFGFFQTNFLANPKSDFLGQQKFGVGGVGVGEVVQEVF